MVTLSAYLNMMFDDGTLADRVDRVANAAFDGFELYGWDADFETITARRDDNDLEFVYLSGNRPPLNDPEAVDAAVTQIRETLALAERVGCRNLNVKAGDTLADVPEATQRETVVEVLRRVASDAEAAGVTLVLEPLNTRVDHPGHLVSTAREGVEIIEDVSSPAVRVLYDIYHEQIMAGDVIRTFRENVEYIGHVHIADNPGRHEPGTGELDYENILATVADSDYDGYVGCEFSPTGEPEDAMEHVRSLR